LLRAERLRTGDGSLEMLAHVFPHLVMPVRPVVAAFRAPVVQMMSDAAVPEHLGHSISGAAVLPRTTAGHEPDVATRVLVEKPGIMLAGHVVDRVIEVEVVVVHPVHGIAHVVDARERVATLHVVGMFEKGVGRVIGTERRSERTYRDAGCSARGVDEGDDFVRYIGVVLRLHPAAMEGVRSLVGEGIALHPVDAEDSDASLVEVRAEGANHALTFLLPLVAHAGGKGEDGQTVMAVNGDAHVAAETV
jgi:hypothetical protein